LPFRRAQDVAVLTWWSSRLGARRSVPSAPLEHGEGIATVRFSGRPEVAGIVQDVRDGIISNLSVGYVTHKYEMDESDGDEIPTMRATDWEPYEISFVPIPADPNAKARADEAHNMRNTEMPNQTNAVPTATESTRAAAEAERTRIGDITAIGRRYKMEQGFIDEHVKNGTAVRDFRDAVLDKLADGQERAPTFPVVETRGMQDEVTTRRAAVANAIMHRANPAGVKLTDAAREWRSMSLIRTAEAVLTAAGERTRGMTEFEIATRALNSTSDFPDPKARRSVCRQRDDQGRVAEGVHGLRPARAACAAAQATRSHAARMTPWRP